jgi:hypothetical protein
MHYEMLRSNLPIPNERTITRYLEKQKGAQEGVLQYSELNDFLEKNGYPKQVWVSEDATKIIEKESITRTQTKYQAWYYPWIKMVCPSPVSL